MKRKHNKIETKPEQERADQHSIQADGMQYREAAFDVRGEGDAEKSVLMSISSETPVLTYAYYNGEYQRVFEVLDHGPGSVDLSRCRDGLVILDNHGGDQIGLMAVSVADRKMSGAVEFCSGARAQEIRQDAIRKLRRNTSVGYRVNAESYRLEGEKDGIPVVRAMSWMPYEASFVAVPADTSVGVGRSEAEATSEKTNKGVQKMKTDERKLTAEDVVEVYRMARSFNMEPGAADEHIRSDKSVEEFRALALKKAEEDLAAQRKEIEKAKTAVPEKLERKVRSATDESAQIFGESENREIAKRYSIMNVVRHLDALRTGGKSNVDIGFELEVSAEMTKRSGKSAQGLYIPHTANILMGRADPFLKAGNGSNFVATNLLVGQLIDALRTKMILNTAGVTTLSGLTGDVAIPKGGTITGGWVSAENGAGTEGKPTVTQVTGTPKTASGWCDISRRLMIQSSIDAEAFVQNELVNTLARLIEVAALAGSNSGGQPKGLTGQPGVNTPSITANAPTRAQLLSFVENIMSDNADFDGMSWLMRPTGWALLANTIEARGVNAAGETVPPGSTAVGGSLMPEYVLDVKTKTMLGFPYHVSMNVPDHALFFGAWSQLVIGLWSGVDLLVDPYTNSTSGATRIVALQDADIMCRHGQSFSYGAALTA
jgi:HK97 family phage major capsid protein